jgi:hypothetical protein
MAEGSIAEGGFLRRQGRGKVLEEFARELFAVESIKRPPSCASFLLIWASTAQ